MAHPLDEIDQSGEDHNSIGQYSSHFSLISLILATKNEISASPKPSMAMT